MNSTAKILNQNNEVVVTLLNFLLACEFILYIKTRTSNWIVDEAKNFELPVFLKNRMKILLQPGKV